MTLRRANRNGRLPVGAARVDNAVGFQRVLTLNLSSPPCIEQPDATILLQVEPPFHAECPVMGTPGPERSL
jgi:hypothetical protein